MHAGELLPQGCLVPGAAKFQVLHDDVGAVAADGTPCSSRISAAHPCQFLAELLLFSCYEYMM